jgi:phosphate transport system protein
VRVRFQQSLTELKERLLVMAGMTEQSIQRAVEAYKTRDISICDLMDREEQAIDRFEREIDQMALQVLAMEHPVAVDLRFTLSVIKINADLERMGNAASSISHRVRDLETFPMVDLPIDIPKMASLATGMVRSAVLAFIDADTDIAQSVFLMNDSLYRLHDKGHTELSSLIVRQPELTPQALNTMMIAQSLERVAKKSKNIAADVIFWVRGADVRQHASHGGKAWTA